MQLFILDNNLAACLLAPEHSPSGFLENFDKDLGRSISTFGQAVFGCISSHQRLAQRLNFKAVQQLYKRVTPSFQLETVMLQFYL